MLSLLQKTFKVSRVRQTNHDFSTNKTRSLFITVKVHVLRISDPVCGYIGNRVLTVLSANQALMLVLLSKELSLYSAVEL